MPENIGEKLSSADEKEPTTKELEIPKSASDEVNPRKKRTTDLAPPVEIQAKLEKEVEDLSKEEIERIMEKVEDINSMGTTSHAVREGSGYVSAKSPESKKRRNFNILSNILNHGIIGGPRNWNDADFLSNEKSIKAIFKNLSYARRAGHGWPTFVVDINELPSDRPFSRVGWIGENGIALIVDKEFAKTKRDRLYKKRIYSRGGKEKSGNTTTSTRIPPRFIKGIVINPVASVKAIEEESKILEKRENIINEILELRKFLYSQVEKQLGDKTKFIVSITDEVKKSHSDVMLKLKELNLQIALVYKEIEKINLI